METGYMVYSLEIVHHLWFVLYCCSDRAATAYTAFFPSFWQS